MTSEPRPLRELTVPYGATPEEIAQAMADAGGQVGDRFILRERPRTFAELPPEDRQPGDTWYLLWCLECTAPEEDGTFSGLTAMPFATERARGTWAHEHLEGTGHGRWRLLNLPRN